MGRVVRTHGNRRKKQQELKKRRGPTDLDSAALRAGRPVAHPTGIRARIVNAN
jgi:hypothetical protein